MNAAAGQGNKGAPFGANLRGTMDNIWSARQANAKEEYPFTYPAMPKKFQTLRRLSRALLLLQRGTGLLMALSMAGAAACVLPQRDIPAGLALLVLISPFLFLGGTLLRFLPGLFWRCPCCGARFPHYWPTFYRDELREKDCLREMDFQRIAWVRPRLCSLIFPSVCPNCGKKFFRLADHAGE